MELSRHLRLAPAGAFCLAAMFSQFAPPLARAQAQADPVYTTLHSFLGTDGKTPAYQALTQGRDGKFYGATSNGGGNGDAGVVYSITAGGGYTLLRVFGNAEDNFATMPDGVIQGRDGNLYGLTTSSTGAVEHSYSGGAFSLDPTGRLRTFYQFYGSVAMDPGLYAQTIVPAGNLCEGLDGNFYGAAYSNPVNTPGSIFKITPTGSLTIIKSLYTSQILFGSLVRDDAGNFYGTMHSSDNTDTIFKVTPDGTLTTLYTFAGNGDGALPRPLVRGSDGNFYGVTSRTTASNTGTVFRITPAGTLTTLYRFAGAFDGYGPNSVVQASDGNLYGVTGGSTTVNGQTIRQNGGTIFRLTPAGVLTTLHRFSELDAQGTNADGQVPNDLIFGSDGNFYGTTTSGGAGGDGVVFRLTVPGVHPAFFTGEVALGNGVDYLAFPGNGNLFGYYAYLSDPHFLYHFDLGYEYVFDAGDGQSGVYLYDFKSGDYLYTSPSFPFPYLYDFTLETVLYYFPDPTNPQRYNTNGVRYFYNFATGQVITR